MRAERLARLGSRAAASCRERLRRGQAGCSSAASSSRCSTKTWQRDSERAVELEGRVLGGGADQHDRAVLDIGQEAVLLGAVEAMDLVDEQQRALARRAALAAPPRISCADRRRRRTPPTAARTASPWPRRAGGRWWSCRSPAVPTGSSRTSRCAATMRPIGPSAPSRWSCPTTSASASGRSRSAQRVAARKRRARPARPALTTPQRNWMVDTSPSRLMLTPRHAARRCASCRSATLVSGWPLTAVDHVARLQAKRPA